MTMVDQFFKQLTPVIWRGSHMGTFLINFLSADNSWPIKKFTGFGMKANYEWKHHDHLISLASFPKANMFPVIEQKFINLFGDDYFKYLVYIYAYAIYKNKSSVENFLNELEHDQILNIIEHQVGLKVIFPYFKLHDSSDSKQRLYIEKISQLNYKDAIHCFFPPNKEAIPALLVLYKKFFYNMFTNEHVNTDHLSDYLYKCWLNKFTSYPYKDSNKNLVTSLLNAKSVDMYRLVFQKDLSDIYKIYPTFEFNMYRQQLLEQAHSTSLKIMECLSVDHSLDSLNDPHPIMNTNQKIDQLFKQYEQMKKGP